MNIAILGAGAMGCLFAGRLLGAGADVKMFDINNEVLEKLNRHGIGVLSDEESRCQYPVAALRAEDSRSHFDLILVFTKAFSTAAAMASVKHLLGPDTYVLTLQNGLGHVDEIAAWVAPSRLLVGVTDIPADLAAIGEVHTRNAGGVRFWSQDGEHRRMLKLVSELFTRAGLPCIADPEVQVAIWHKAAFNAALNALCTVLRQPVGRLGQSEDGRWLATKVIEESSRVALALGIEFDTATVLASVEQVYTQQADHRPSMLQDRLAGRASEIENINGAILKLAREQGLAVPVLESLYRLVRMGEPG